MEKGVSNEKKKSDFIDIDPFKKGADSYLCFSAFLPVIK